MATAMKKVEKIRQIVHLKQLMKRWKNLTLRRRRTPFSRSDDSPPSCPISAGLLPVFVGPERRRFLIPVRFLNFPVITSLFAQARDEYGGSPSPSPLPLLCEVEFFRTVLELLEKDEERYKSMELVEFDDIYSFGYLLLDFSGKDSSSDSSRHGFWPEEGEEEEKGKDGWISLLRRAIWSERFYLMPLSHRMPALWLKFNLEGYLL